MQPSIPRGNRTKTVQPVIITTENKFKPKISERTIKKREEEKERRLKGGKYASGLDTCGVICLYVFLALCVVIGAGGIGVCGYYLNSDSSTVGWKVAGIVLGIITCIIGVILILLTVFKQARNRPWRYKKEEELYKDNGDYSDMGDDDDDDRTNIESLDDDKIYGKEIIHRDSLDGTKGVARSAFIHSTRETASSPIPDPDIAPLQVKTMTSEMIFCPGCNRTHPSAHQCMYSTRIPNGFSIPFRPILSAPQQDSIAIQTEEEEMKKKKRRGPHTVIDRSIKYSNTTETQTDVSANPRSNITESIILRRVPIPTAKVVVQQPTTKVMIVKVPNVAGQLVIQPKSATTDEQSK